MKTITKILGIIVVAGLFYLGYRFVSDLLFGKALEKAKAQYQAEIADQQAKITAAELKYQQLAISAAMAREKLLEQHAAKIREIEKVFAVEKSQSAADLKKKGATLAQVLIEKQKNERALAAAKQEIIMQRADYVNLAGAWAQSDLAKDAAHREVVDALEIKYQACSTWSAKLEAKLKPHPWAKVGQVALVVGAFVLGAII